MSRVSGWEPIASGRKVHKMKNEDRTKAQLIEELKEMHGRVAELEAEGRSAEQASHQAKEALQESERRYHLLAENMTDVVWTVDMSLRFIWVSPSVTRLRGYSVEEVMGQTLKDVLTPASLKVAKKALVEGLRVEEQKDLFESPVLELEFNCEDGSTIWAEVKMTVLQDPDGWPVGIQGVFRDITERKRREEERLRSERQESLGMFAGGLAHEFNNILAAILGNISLAQLDVNPEDKVFERLKEAEKASLRARDLMQRLLTVAGREAPLKEVGSIAELLKEIPPEKEEKEGPLSEEHQERPAVVQAGKGRILVMDDEEIVREVAGRMLEYLGYEVEVAVDGVEALERYQKARESGEPFDAVIMDVIVAGGMGGEEAIRKLLEIDSEAKAIVSSGSRDPAMTEFAQYGFRGVIAKPYRIAELSEVVRRVITRTSEEE